MDVSSVKPLRVLERVAQYGWFKYQAHGDGEECSLLQAGIKLQAFVPWQATVVQSVCLYLGNKVCLRLVKHPVFMRSVGLNPDIRHGSNLAVGAA